MPKATYKSTLHACYLGYITQALIVNLPPLLFVIFRDTFGLSYTMLSSLVVVIFITQLWSMRWRSGWLTKSGIGRRLSSRMYLPPLA